MNEFLTWKCHVCGEERPDARISVRSISYDLGFTVVQLNVRYCNDRHQCISGIAGADFVRGMERIAEERKADYEQNITAPR